MIKNCLFVIFCLIGLNGCFPDVRMAHSEGLSAKLMLEFGQELRTSRVSQINIKRVYTGNNKFSGLKACFNVNEVLCPSDLSASWDQVDGGRYLDGVKIRERFGRWEVSVPDYVIESGKLSYDAAEALLMKVISSSLDAVKQLPEFAVSRDRVLARESWSGDTLHWLED